MKTMTNKLYIILVLLMVQFCKSQDRERYINNYNEAVPKLQQLATSKKEFYGKNFSVFLNDIEKKKIKIMRYGFSGKTDINPQIYSLRIYFTNQDDFDLSQDQGYQMPFVTINFQKQIPDELRQLTLKYHGELTQEVKDFLDDRKIETIEFYGINGLTSKDRSAR